jgi:hypothetical protein
VVAIREIVTLRAIGKEGSLAPNGVGERIISLDVVEFASGKRE